MGLPVSVDVRDEDPGDAVAEVFAWLREVDRRFSPFRPGSEVSRFGRGELSRPGPELAEILDLCAHYEHATGGAFTCRLPGRGFDPCAVVKGWAVDRAAARLRDAGLSRFCLNAGGDVVVSGEPRPGQAWRVGIRHPDDAHQVCAVLALCDGAVATSGCYERGAHIVDGRSGLPATGLASLTVVAGDLTVADATATAAFALGADGPAWAAARPGCLVFAVDSARRVHASPGLPRAA